MRVILPKKLFRRLDYSNENIRKHYLDIVWRIYYCTGIPCFGLFAYMHSYWYSFRIASSEARHVGVMSIRKQSYGKEIDKRLFEHVYECTLVFCRWNMDCVNSFVFGNHLLCHHCRNSIRQTAFQIDKIGLISFWKRNTLNNTFQPNKILHYFIQVLRNRK